MIRDPLYRKIIDGLKGPLDPELFEQCAADLLRAIYPTLVPIRGGTDSGMDGAIADFTDEPFSLISTTSKNVIGNLTRSLNSYLQDGGTRRKAVLATSQELTPQRLRNLYKRARELGFVLVQVHAREAIANLLYRNPKWCLELLNLTGDPAPLSVVPRTERPLLTHTLVGREADLTWLRQNSGDRLLVGQPGSGKTFLLYQFALEGGGLFVVNEDRGEISAAIRSEQPEVLLVDDAQVHRDLLLDLRQMREALDAKYSILASCWPGDEEAITQSLNLPDLRIRRLDLLTRDEIVEVVKASGLHGPNELIREIVNQAEGRPGLVVTLAHLCLQGGVREVALGDVLSGSVLKFFEPVVGQRASVLLAAFSVGGDAGMPMKVVADELGLNLVDVRGTVTKLAAGGVISEVGQHCLSVRPPALRYALVRDVFFRGAASLPIERLLAQAPSLPEAAHTLIEARVRGAAIPQELLIEVLEYARSEDAWRKYAWLGRDEARWVLTHHPEKIITIARPALHQAPETAIPLLLNTAIGDQRQLHSTPEHPLRLINDWVCAGHPGTGEALGRREVLLDSVQTWLSGGGDIGIGLRAFQSVLSPNFEDYITDPGMGNTITIRHGYLLLDELIAVRRLWSKIIDTIRMIGIPDWEPLRNMVTAWAYARWPDLKISSEMSSTMRAFAAQMLRDVVSLAEDHPGILHWANQIVQRLDLELEVPEDQDFETLYPNRGFEDWKAAGETESSVVRKLATVWSTLNPEHVAKRIALIEQEARLADVRWPRWTSFLCTEIAEKVISPNNWVRAMIDADSTNDLVTPFLRKAAVIEEPGWTELAIACLDRPTLRETAILLILTLPNPPENLLAQVLLKIEGHAGLVELLCVRNQIPGYLVERLLRHEDAAIASATAQGEWYADPEGTIRDSLRKNWQDVVINRVSDDHWLSRVLKDDPLLAYDWLQAYVTKQPSAFFKHENAVKAAVGALDVDARRRILRQIPETYEDEELVACLIGDDLDLYRDLLSNKQFKPLHLVPLSGHPEGVWIEKAKLALDAGYSIGDVASAAYSPHMFLWWSGNESDMWAGWYERFDRLCSHEDERIRRVGEEGRARAKMSLDRALKQERNESIYGMQ